MEGQRYSKRLNERQITALLKVTCQRPVERERDIMQVSRLLSVVLILVWTEKFMMPSFCTSCFSLG